MLEDEISTHTPINTILSKILLLNSNLPSVSVALSSILKNFVFQDELLTSSLHTAGFVRPVPNETTHWIGQPGHNCFASWTATAVGLFTKRPPS